MAGIRVRPDKLSDLANDPEWSPKIAAARQQGISFETIQQELIDRGVMNKPGTTANVAKTGFTDLRAGAATAVRVGLPIALAMLKPRSIAMGTMAGETLARVIEGKRLGLEDTKGQAEVVMAGVGSRLAPGLEGGTTAGAIKGAGFGMFTTSVQSLIETGKLPTTGQMSLGIALGSGLTAGGRHFLKPALYNITSKPMAEEVAAILTRPSDSIVPATAAEKESIKEIQGISFVGKGGKSGELPGQYSYTERNPENYYKARARRPMLEGVVTPKEYGGKLTKQRPMDFFGEQPEAPTGPTQEVQGVTFVGKGEESGTLDFTKSGKPIPEYPTEVDYVNASAKAHRNYGVPKVYFDSVQRHTGIPVYEDVYHPVQIQYKKKAVLDHDVGSVFAKASDVIRHRGREKYQAFLEMGRTDEVADKLDLKVGDRMRTQNIQDGWHQMFEAFGMSKDDADRHLTEVLPKLRAASHELDPGKSGNVPVDKIIDHAYPVDKPPSLHFFEGMYKNEIAGFHDTDALGIAMRHLNYGTSKTYLEPTFNAINAKYSNAKIPPAIKESITKYMQQVQGASDPTGADLAAIISKAAEKLRWDLKPKDARALVNTLIASTYGGTMGLRPGPIIRNSLQTVLTGYSELGPKYFTEAAVMASQKKGKELGTMLGLLEGEQGITGEVQQLITQAKGSKYERFASSASGVTTKMLASYKSRDDYNRMLMGLGQWNRAQRALRIAKGDAEKFMDYAGLNSSGFLDSEREIIKQKYLSGDTFEAARLSSIAVADNTQWQYGPGNRPPMLTGTAGRALGGFATWAMYYANYLKRTANPLVARKGDAVRFGRWVLANAAVWGAAGTLGTGLGIEHPWARAAGNVGLGAGTYTPGGAPLARAISEGAQSFQELTQGTVGGQHQKQFGKQLMTAVPGYGMSQDFLHLIKPDKGEGEAIGRVSGISPRLFSR